MGQVTVRVIRTWEATVDAEYGDDDDSLKAKVTEKYLDSVAPNAETRVVLEDHASQYETLQEYLEANTDPDTGMEVDH